MLIFYLFHYVFCFVWYFCGPHSCSGLILMLSLNVFCQPWYVLVSVFLIVVGGHASTLLMSLLSQEMFVNLLSPMGVFGPLGFNYYCSLCGRSMAWFVVRRSAYCNTAYICISFCSIAVAEVLVSCIISWVLFSVVWRVFVQAVAKATVSVALFLSEMVSYYSLIGMWGVFVTFVAHVLVIVIAVFVVELHGPICIIGAF